jgi:hypothetical protein
MKYADITDSRMPANFALLVRGFQAAVLNTLTDFQQTCAELAYVQTKQVEAVPGRKHDYIYH